jgi:hypothetical protein
MPKFDVIIGNPPYQGPRIGGGDASGNAIWHRFIELSYNLLKDNGYLCYIHPISWRMDMYRKKIAKARDILFSNQIEYLCLFITPFNKISIVVDWYVLQKTPIHKKSIIKYTDIENLEFIKKDIIINCGNPLIKNILNKVLTVNNNGLYSRKAFGGLTIFDKSYPEQNYIFAHGARSFGTKKIFKYFKYPHIHQFKIKVIIPDIGIDAYIDNGVLGIGDHLHYIIVNNLEEAEYFKKIIKSKLMIFLQKIYSGDIWIGNSPMRWNSSYPMSKIKIENLKINSDKELYEHFNLTKEEIDYIESQVK